MSGTQHYFAARRATGKTSDSVGCLRGSVESASRTSTTVERYIEKTRHEDMEKLKTAMHGELEAFSHQAGNFIARSHSEPRPHRRKVFSAWAISNPRKKSFMDPRCNGYQPHHHHQLRRPGISNTGEPSGPRTLEQTARTYIHRPFPRASGGLLDVPFSIFLFPLWPPELQVPDAGPPGRRRFVHHLQKTDSV